MTGRKILGIICLALLLWLGVRWLLPLTAPFWAGWLLALAAEPAVETLHRKAKFPRGAAVGLGVTLTCLILILTVGFFCAVLFRELGRALPQLEQTARTGVDSLHTMLLSLADRSPAAVRRFAQEHVEQLFGSSHTLAQQGLGYGLSLAGGVLKGVPDSALTLGTAVLSGYMLSFRLPALRLWADQKEFLRPVRVGWRRVKLAAGGWLRAQCKLMAVTLLLVAAGLLLLRVPNALLWGLGIALVDALPILGCGTVLIPWSVLCFVQGDSPRALGLLGLYLTAALLRSVLEPRLLGHHLGLDPLVTLFCLYAGFQLLGIWGMLLAPLLAVTAAQAAGEDSPAAN